MPESDPLAKLRNQSLALGYAPQARRNLAIIDQGSTVNLEDTEFGIPLVDIYINDLCNLRCQFCPTKFGTNNLPIRAVEEIARLRPRVLTLTGGGEPTLYRDGTNRIGDFIAEIRKHMGSIPLGMMTNGTNLMSTSAAEELEWLRVSLNASTPESYKTVHRSPLFNKVIQNVVAYLKMEIPKVGIGFVYTPETVDELMSLAQVVLEKIFPNLSREEQSRLTLQFRPEANADYERYTLSEGEIEGLKKQWEGLPTEVRTLLAEQSNIAQVMENQCFTTKGSFDRCSISILQMNIDAKGDTYPCPQKAHAFKDSYGNILEPNFFDDLRMRIRESYRGHNHATCGTCSQARVNNEYGTLDLGNIPLAQSMPTTFF